MLSQKAKCQVFCINKKYSKMYFLLMQKYGANLSKFFRYLAFREHVCVLVVICRSKLLTIGIGTLLSDCKRGKRLKRKRNQTKPDI